MNDDTPAGKPKQRAFDGSFLFIVGFALSGAIACFAVHGRDMFVATVWSELGLLAQIVPVICGGVLLGAILQCLVPQPVVRRWLGEGSGWRGLAIAAVVGALVPGGPVTSFPLVAALVGAGAEIGVTMTFLTSWATLGINRVIVWEVPFMGGDFAVLRYLVSLPLPFVAGFSARWLAKVLDRR